MFRIPSKEVGLAGTSIHFLDLINVAYNRLLIAKRLLAGDILSPARGGFPGTVTETTKGHS